MAVRTSPLLRLGLDKAALRQAGLLAFAAWLAFALASSLHITNAYWAAMPVWVVAQASRGLMFARGFLRILGTLIGAAVGFGMLHLIPNHYFLLLALGLWVGFNTALTHVLRGVTAYGALMSGMTAAIVILPTVFSPERSWDIAIARVECTLIGVGVVTLVTALFTPAASRSALVSRARLMARQAVRFAASVLEGVPQDRLAVAERQLLAEMSSVTQAADQMTAGSLRGSRRRKRVDALVAAALLVMSAGRAASSREASEETVARVLADLDRLARHFEREAEAEGEAPLGEGLDPRLSDSLRGLVAAEAALSADRPAGDELSGLVPAFLHNPHGDWSLGTTAGAVSGLATWLAASAAYAANWPVGELAALGCCIFSMVLGSLAQPQAIAPHMLKGVLAGVAAALIYRFGVQPHVQTVPELLVSVAPFLLLGGLARASRRTAIAAIDANMCFLLASQAVLPAVTRPAAILSEAGALVAAAVLVTSSFILLPRRHDRHAAKAREDIRRDLERLIANPQARRGARWDQGMTRQIMRLTLHLARAGESGGGAARGLLGVLNLGVAATALQRLMSEGGLADEDRRLIAQGLAALGRFRTETPRPEIFDEAARTIANAEAARAMKEAAAAFRQAEPFLDGA